MAGGGHAMAAGLTVAADKLDELAQWLDDRLARDVASAQGAQALTLDLAVAPRGLHPDLVTALESDSLMDLMRSMREHAVRRVPVVGLQDELIGLVTMDDVLKILAQELTLLVGSVDTGLKREKKRRQ